MRSKRERVDETVAHIANAIAHVREWTASLRAISTNTKPPMVQLFYFQSAALHRGVPILVAIR